MLKLYSKVACSSDTGNQGLPAPFQFMTFALCRVDNMPLNIEKEIRQKWSCSDLWPDTEHQTQSGLFPLTKTSTWATIHEAPHPATVCICSTSSAVASGDLQEPVLAGTLLRHLGEFHPVTLCAEQESKYKQMLWWYVMIVSVSEKLLLRRQKISMLAVFSCLGMSQHHGPWLRFRFCRSNASPTHAVVRCDAFLFLGSVPHTHPGLWLISLCSRRFWSTEVFGRRSAEWLFISSCFHDIISVWVWSSGLASLLKPGHETIQGSTELFNC